MRIISFYFGSKRNHCQRGSHLIDSHVSPYLTVTSPRPGGPVCTSYVASVRTAEGGVFVFAFFDVYGPAILWFWGYFSARSVLVLFLKRVVTRRPAISHISTMGPGRQLGRGRRRGRRRRRLDGSAQVRDRTGQE